MTSTPALFDLQAPGRGGSPADGMPVDGVLATAPRTFRVLALDLSLTATGAAGNDGEHGWALTIKPPKNMVGHDRLAYISGAIFDLLTGVDYCAVEGPAFGAKGSAYHQLAGQWWMVTHSIWARGIPCAVVPPNIRAKYATGKAQAGKDEVMREVARGFMWFNGDNNAADALVIAAMTADHLGEPMVAMPATHRAALDSVDWPELRAGVR